MVSIQTRTFALELRKYKYLYIEESFSVDEQRAHIYFFC